MHSEIENATLAHYEASSAGRTAILRSSLQRLAVALGLERRLPVRQIEIMAEDLANAWAYSLEELLEAFMLWRLGTLEGLSERQLLRFPRTVQVVAYLKRRPRVRRAVPYPPYSIN